MKVQSSNIYHGHFIAKPNLRIELDRVWISFYMLFIVCCLLRADDSGQSFSDIESLNTDDKRISDGAQLWLSLEPAPACRTLDFSALCEAQHFTSSFNGT